ncbi:hypothetical protein XF36_13955 [Pseudonocardia sp. HH130629-09]|nr:hypothetical protein XF36_13955 [Pseudonocardia sp. HH130629-09]
MRRRRWLRARRGEPPRRPRARPPRPTTARPPAPSSPAPRGPLTTWIRRRMPGMGRPTQPAPSHTPRRSPSPPPPPPTRRQTIERRGPVLATTDS